MHAGEKEALRKQLKVAEEEKLTTANEWALKVSEYCPKEDMSELCSYFGVKYQLFKGEEKERWVCWHLAGKLPQNVHGLLAISIA